MLDDHAVDQLADRLHDALVSCTPVGDLPPELTPVDVTDGYRVQRRFQEVAGFDLGPWKVGASSEASQQVLGVPGPFLGRPDLACVVPSGSTVTIAGAHVGQPAIEIEVGLRLRRDLDVVPDDHRALAGDVDVVPCIEIVDSRFGAVIGTPGPCLVADNGAASGLVVGEPIDVDTVALGALPVVLEIDGTDPVRGTGAAALGHPLRSLAVAARLAAELGTPMLAGQVVSTGTCTGLTPVAAGTEVVGRVGDATVTVTFD